MKPKLKDSKLLILSALVLAFFQASTFSQIGKADFSLVPGTVIDHSPASQHKYIGSPSIVVLPGGEYIASHDFFGPGGKRRIFNETVIYRSEDKGETWNHIATIGNQWWSTLFYFREELYIIGTSGGRGDMVIRKSTDKGDSWTSPADEYSGIIAKGTYHCAPVPVIEHNGRIWRAMEKFNTDGNTLMALMISAPIDKDLLKASSWTLSNVLRPVRHWYNGDMETWREGNVVVKPDGHMANIIRVEIAGAHNVAALMDVSDDGGTISFDPNKGFITFPDGTGKKFVIRYDPVSEKYWAVSNWIQPRDLKYLKHKDAGSIRNCAVLISSSDLVDWTIERILLYHPDNMKHAFQYPDWDYDGEDIVAVFRTCYDDGLGGAPNHHDANFMTFLRVADFRDNLNRDEILNTN